MLQELSDFKRWHIIDKPEDRMSQLVLQIAKKWKKEKKKTTQFHSSQAGLSEVSLHAINQETEKHLFFQGRKVSKQLKNIFLSYEWLWKHTQKKAIS